MTLPVDPAAVAGGLALGAAAAALAAGFLGSAHCAAMCGPLRTAAGASTRAGVAWHAGRYLAYGSLGALAGAIGGVRILASPVGPYLALAALAWFAGDLAGLPVPGRRLLTRVSSAVLPRVARAGGAGDAGRFLFGMGTALLPCGLLWSGLAMAGTTGTPTGGLSAMTAFYVGTLPALGLAGWLGTTLSGWGVWARRGVAVGVLALGSWSIAARAGWFPHDHPVDTPNCAAPGGSDVP